MARQHAQRISEARQPRDRVGHLLGRAAGQIDPAPAVGEQRVAAEQDAIVGGQKATSYFEGGEEYEVHVRAGEADRNDPAAISAMEVPAATRGTVPLRDVVSLQEATGPSLINRYVFGKGNVLITGQAAGFLNMIGEGMSCALHSGAICGEA